MARREDTKELQLAYAREQILRQPWAKLYIWNLLEQCGVFQTTDFGEYTHSAARADGKRKVGMDVLTELLDTNDDALSILRREARLYDERSDSERNDDE